VGWENTRASKVRGVWGEKEREKKERERERERDREENTGAAGRFFFLR
jgi:hypothetical protein